MIYSGNQTPAEAGMVLLPYAIRANAPCDLALSLDHTILITESGSEALSRLTPEYSVCV